MDFKEWNKAIIKEFRENGGVVGGDFEGKPLLLLHNTGAKSGEPRVNPLMYDTEDDRVLLFASMGGAPRNPDWFYNVIKNPEVELEFGDRTEPMRASVADKADRDRFYARMAAKFPQFAEYERQTDREIPVVILSPR